MSYGEADSHPSGFEQGNTGYSGAPMWKIKLQTQQYRAVVEAAQAQRLEEAKKAVDEKMLMETKPGPKILVDAFVVRGSKGAQLVRHMLVKDLRKAALVMNMELPTEGIFDDQGGQRALFALFDGQSSASPAPQAAEMCCRNVLGKILRNLLSLPSGSCTATFVKAALLKTFEDLEKELASAGVQERCGASLALVIGDWLFTAVLGSCGATLYQTSASDHGKEKAIAAGPSASTSVTAEGYTATLLSSPPARESPTMLPGQSFGMPEVKGTQMQNLDSFFILSGVMTNRCVSAQEMITMATGFIRRPRAASGEISTRAAAAAGEGSDCATVVAYIKQPEPDVPEKGGMPPAKKAKKEPQQMDSVRLRHVVVRYKDGKQAVNPVNNKPVTRSREEAEAVLREALRELLKDGDHTNDSAWAAKVTPRILNVCRAQSECRSAMKGGSNCGDLGWLSKKELQKMGKEGFVDNLFGLGIAEWSDLLFTLEGAHLMMRMA